MTRDTLKIYNYGLAVMLIIALLVHISILWNARSHVASGYGDFAIFYGGAQIVDEGRAADLYNADVQRAYQAKFGIARETWTLPFNHAPYQLLIFLPLTYFPYPVAHLIWGIVNLLLLVLICCRLAPFVDPNYNLLMYALVFASYPTMVTLLEGQDSILTMYILVEVFASLKRHREVTAGGLLACGLYKPHLVLPFAGLLFVDGRWHGLLAFSISAAFLAGVSLAMVGWKGVLDYVPLLNNSDYVVFPGNMANIRGLFHSIAGNYVSTAQANLLTMFVSILLYIGSLYLCRRVAEDVDSRLDLNFSLICVATVLVSYHLYAHDLLVLLLPLILMLNHVLAGRTEAAVIQVSFLALLLLFSIPLLPSVLSKERQLAWGTLPILSLYVLIAVEILRRTPLHSRG